MSEAVGAVQSLSRAAAEGRPLPKVLYTVPIGQNPASFCIPAERRHKIYEICQRHDLLILEDDPYWAMQFPAESGVAFGDIWTVTTLDRDSFQSIHSTDLAKTVCCLEASCGSRVPFCSVASSLGWWFAAKQLWALQQNTQPPMTFGACILLGSALSMQHITRRSVLLPAAVCLTRWHHEPTHAPVTEINPESRICISPSVDI